jgi:hypothetical protein
MAFDAGTILGHLKLDRSGFTSGMLEAGGITKLLGGDIGAFLANPLLGVANMAMDAAKAIKDLVFGTVQAGVEFGRLAETTGASVHFLSGVAYACKQVDLPAEQAAESFNQLIRGIRQSASGVGPAADAFRELGIKVTDSSGQLRPAEQLFMETADAIAGMDNATARASIAQEIFGRGGMRLLPILTQGSAGINGMIAKADELGVTMGDEDVASAEDFHHSMIDLKATWDGLMQSFAMPLLKDLGPIFKDLATILKDVVGPILHVVSVIVSAILKAIAYAVHLAASLGFSSGASPEEEGAFNKFVYGDHHGSSQPEYSSGLDGVARIVGQHVRDAYDSAHPQGSVTVNVQVSPEDSARRVADKVAPVISRNVQGVQHSIETSTRRQLSLNQFEQQMGVS